jgi:hypothetical protein
MTIDPDFVVEQYARKKRKKSELVHFWRLVSLAKMDLSLFSVVFAWVEMFGLMVGP